MNKTTIPALVVAALLAPTGALFADLCTVDDVPAATLLLPYFAVDLTPDPEGVNTLFSINNASAAPTIAHISVWTDWSQPVLDFDIFLTGYDVQTVNLFSVFSDGDLPVTSDEQSDPDDTISPHGLNPEWDGSFLDTGVFGAEDCASIFPFFINPVLQGTRLEELQAKLTGKPVDGACFGADHGDAIARGYITIDNADTCSLLFPNDPGYFTDGINPAIANNNNVLWGDVFHVNWLDKSATGQSLVHIEATDDPDWATGYTFYGRYSVPNAALDGREPLGTSWATRYLQGAFSGGTSLMVWRDATILDINEDGYACGAAGSLDVGPVWHPLNEREVVAFNEAESAVSLCAGVFGDEGPPISPPDDPDFTDPVCFPLETQQVQVGAGNLATPYSFGWMFLNLNVGIDDGGGAFDLDPGSEGTLAQSWVSARHSALGAFSVGLPAIELTSACDDLDVVLSGTWVIPDVE